MTTLEIMKALNTAKVDWNALVSDMKDTDAGAVPSHIRDIDRAIEELVRFRFYWEANQHATTHAAGVSAQNKAARKVRKMLGYAYPKQEVTF